MPLNFTAEFLLTGQGDIDPEAKPIALVGRHGRTELNDKNLFRGTKDVPLNEIGRKQASEVAEFVSKYPIASIHSSPMTRAMQMAEAVAKLTGLEVVEAEELLPWDVGILSGKDRKKYERVLRYYVEHPDERIEGGERLDDFEERTKDFFNGHLKDATPERVRLFFAHTSNLVGLSNLIAGTRVTQPEIGEVVKAGGVCAVYRDGSRYAMQPVFGHIKPARFGG